MSADLRHVDIWLFDLDNTLYPVESSFMGLIEKKMTAYVARGSPACRTTTPSRCHRSAYLREHGTTLAGLMANHGIDPQAYLDEVHDVSLDSLTPDPALREALGRLPGRLLVFTNGDAPHAARVLAKLNLADRFEATFHIASADYLPKPNPAEPSTRSSPITASTPSLRPSSRTPEKNLRPGRGAGHDHSAGRPACRGPRPRPSSNTAPTSSRRS